MSDGPNMNMADEKNYDSSYKTLRVLSFIYIDYWPCQNIHCYCLFSRDGQGAKVKERPGAIQVICTAVVAYMYCYNSDASNDTDIF